MAFNSIGAFYLYASSRLNAADNQVIISLMLLNHELSERRRRHLAIRSVSQHSYATSGAQLYLLEYDDMQAL